MVSCRLVRRQWPVGATVVGRWLAPGDSMELREPGVREVRYVPPGVVPVAFAAAALESPTDLQRPGERFMIGRRNLAGRESGGRGERLDQFPQRVLIRFRHRKDAGVGAIT